MTTAATASAYYLTQSNYALDSTATYTIYYTSYNLMESGSTFLITYPSGIEPASTLTTCNAKCGGVSYSMTCTVSSSANTITFSGTGISNSVSAGSKIEISFGPVTNPSTNLYTIDSLSLTSYSD